MSELPKYVSYEPDRHGSDRWYYRRHGQRTRLEGSPGQEAFASSYDLAHTGHSAPKRAARTKISAFVYFIRYGNKRVKIGTCANVKARLQQLRTGIPGKAVVHYVTPGGRKLEAELHNMFAVDRISGEWFQFSAPIKKWILDDETRRQKERGVNRASPTHVAPGQRFAVALSDRSNNSLTPTSYQ